MREGKTFFISISLYGFFYMRVACNQLTHKILKELKRKRERDSNQPREREKRIPQAHTLTFKSHPRESCVSLFFPVSNSNFPLCVLNFVAYLPLTISTSPSLYSRKSISLKSSASAADDKVSGGNFHLDIQSIFDLTITNVCVISD